MSPQLPANPSLEGVGIFFDPPDDLTPKQEVTDIVELLGQETYMIDHTFLKVLLTNKLRYIMINKTSLSKLLNR